MGGKKVRIRTAKELPGVHPGGSVREELGTPKVLNVLSEQARELRAEEQRAERNKRKKEREGRRQHQIERNNKKGHKKIHKTPGIGQGRVRSTADPGKPNIPRPLETVYITQEELFHAIDSLLKGLFAAGRQGSWGADAYADRFKPPPGMAPDAALQAWAD